MKKWFWLSGGFVVLVLAIGILSPFYSVYQIKIGVSENNTDKLSKYVEFSELRINLKGQLNESLEKKFSKRSVEPESRFGNLTVKFAKRFANRLVDSYVTAEGLGKLMGGDSKNKDQNNPKEPAGDTSMENPEDDQKESRFTLPSDGKLKLLKNARFSFESMNRFRITMPTKNNRQIQFILSRDGIIWRLNNIILPI